MLILQSLSMKFGLGTGLNISTRAGLPRTQALRRLLAHRVVIILVVVAVGGFVRSLLE